MGSTEHKQRRLDGGIDKFSDTYMNLGIIISGEIDDLKELKKHMAEFMMDKQLKAVYQTISPNKLMITKEKEE